MSHGVKSNNLFHTLHQRYGQSLIKEVRSLEGKEHKLVRFKQHRVFNLRCLKENVAINLASKDLSPGEVKLLQKGPKFAVSTPNVPITEYIAVTKQICDKLGENTEGVDCSEYYQKTKDLLQDYTRKRAAHPNLSKMERDAIRTLKEDNT